MTSITLPDEIYFTLRSKEQRTSYGPIGYFNDSKQAFDEYYQYRDGRIGSAIVERILDENRRAKDIGLELNDEALDATNYEDFLYARDEQIDALRRRGNKKAFNLKKGDEILNELRTDIAVTQQRLSNFSENASWYTVPTRMLSDMIADSIIDQKYNGPKGILEVISSNMIANASPTGLARVIGQASGLGTITEELGVGIVAGEAAGAAAGAAITAATGTAAAPVIAVAAPVAAGLFTIGAITAYSTLSRAGKDEELLKFLGAEVPTVWDEYKEAYWGNLKVTVALGGAAVAGKYVLKTIPKTASKLREAQKRKGAMKAAYDQFDVHANNEGVSERLAAYSKMAWKDVFEYTKFTEKSFENFKGAVDNTLGAVTLATLDTAKAGASVVNKNIVMKLFDITGAYKKAGAMTATDTTFSSVKYVSDAIFKVRTDAAERTAINRAKAPGTSIIPTLDDVLVSTKPIGEEVNPLLNIKRQQARINYGYEELQKSMMQSDTQKNFVSSNAVKMLNEKKYSGARESVYEFLNNSVGVLTDEEINKHLGGYIGSLETLTKNGEKYGSNVANNIIANIERDLQSSRLQLRAGPGREIDWGGIEKTAVRARESLGRLTTESGIKLDMKEIRAVYENFGTDLQGKVDYVSILANKLKKSNPTLQRLAVENNANFYSSRWKKWNTVNTPLEINNNLLLHTLSPELALDGLTSKHLSLANPKIVMDFIDSVFISAEAKASIREVYTQSNKFKNMEFTMPLPIEKIDQLRTNPTGPAGKSPRELGIQYNAAMNTESIVRKLSQNTNAEGVIVDVVSNYAIKDTHTLNIGAEALSILKNDKLGLSSKLNDEILMALTGKYVSTDSRVNTIKAGLNKASSYIVNNFRRLGVDVGLMDDYFITSTNPLTVLKEGENYKTFLYKNLDWSTIVKNDLITELNDSVKIDYVNSIYKSIKDSYTVHNKTAATSPTKGKKLFFNSGEAYVQYLKEFGKSSNYEYLARNYAKVYGEKLARLETVGSMNESMFNVRDAIQGSMSDIETARAVREVSNILNNRVQAEELNPAMKFLYNTASVVTSCIISAASITAGVGDCFTRYISHSNFLKESVSPFVESLKVYTKGELKGLDSRALSAQRAVVGYAKDSNQLVAGNKFGNFMGKISGLDIITDISIHNTELSFMRALADDTIDIRKAPKNLRITQKDLDIVRASKLAIDDSVPYEIRNPRKLLNSQNPAERGAGRRFSAWLEDNVATGTLGHGDIRTGRFTSTSPTNNLYKAVQRTSMPFFTVPAQFFTRVVPGILRMAEFGNPWAVTVGLLTYHAGLGAIRNAARSLLLNLEVPDVASTEFWTQSCFDSLFLFDSVLGSMVTSSLGEGSKGYKPPVTNLLFDVALLGKDIAKSTVSDDTAITRRIAKIVERDLPVRRLPLFGKVMNDIIIDNLIAGFDPDPVDYFNTKNKIDEQRTPYRLYSRGKFAYGYDE